MGIREYMKQSIAEPVVVPEKLTREYLIEWSKRWAESRTKRIWYNPITPEMNEIMNRMIEELPDGTYRIKTTKDDLDNSKS